MISRRSMGTLNTNSRIPDFILPSPSSPFVSVRKRKRDMPRQQSPRRRRHDSGDTSIATPKSSSHVLSAAYGTSISSGPRRRAATPKLKAADPSGEKNPHCLPNILYMPACLIRVFGRTWLPCQYSSLSSEVHGAFAVLQKAHGAG